MADEVQIVVSEVVEQVLVNVDEINESTEVIIQVDEVLGVNGLSAYEIAVQDGFVGTEQQWLLSLKGDTGTTGLSGGSYTHDQATPSAVWTVVHNLGYFPNVSVVDSANSLVIGDVSYTDNNTLTLTFNGAFAGKAYVS